MKIWIKTAVAAVMLFATSALTPVDAQAGEKTIGVGAGYNTYNNDALAGIEFTYQFSRHFRIAPNVQYAFRNHHRDGLIANLNFHFPVLSAPVLSFYPLVGIGYASWTNHPYATTDDVSTRDNNFGLNAGAGLGFKLPGALRLSLEGNYNIIKHSSGASFMARIAYAF